LALKYSLPKVKDALAVLRIKAGQKFFPRPDEVADEIESIREHNVYKANQRDWERQQASWRYQEEQDRAKYGDWKSRWFESGMTLAQFIAAEDAEGIGK
jgi:hypothetical protein